MTLSTRVMRTRVMVSSFVVAFAGLTAPALAQTSSRSPVEPLPHRTIEGYYSHYRFDAPGDRLGMNGIGARLMWRPPAIDDAAPNFVSRLAVGLFGEYVPDQDKGFAAGHVGLQGDLNLVTTPLFGRLSPILSVGAGGFWTDRVGPALDSREFSIANRSIKSFAVTPAFGVRAGLWRQLGLRADIRDLVTFEERTLHHVQASAGLTLPF